jgi:hypothetical protein
VISNGFEIHVGPAVDLTPGDKSGKRTKRQEPMQIRQTPKSKRKSKRKSLAKGKYLKAKVCSRLRVVILEMILGRVQMSSERLRDLSSNGRSSEMYVVADAT